ncbi:hypothetical protein [Macrococcoides canis]|uniref:hypothetical protein n=1 Tax=Macrococcoides canis TaxID=1855823 RepID=UPI00165E225B|nr:hypothetical protein [Macrococcus canis]QNR09112.1 hypothetical protein GL258_12565 [Macrococcus canis]
MNEFDKQLIEELKNIELNSLSTVSNERRNLLRLREYLICILDRYEHELQDFSFENRLAMSERIINELNLELNYLKVITDYKSIDIEYIAMLIEISDITYELSTLIDNIKNNKKINLSSRVSNFLRKPHRLILRIEMLNAELESIYLFEDDDEEE